MPKKETPPLKKAGPPEIDLRPICMDSNRHEVTVTLITPFEENRFEWLRLGLSCLEIVDHSRMRSRWHLTAKVDAESPERSGPTDYDHDNIFACKLPLVGVSFAGIHYHQVIVRGFIDPTIDVNDEHNAFRVPASSNYDPRKDPEAFECEDKHCLRGSEGRKHTIVPDGYVPKFNRALYEVVRGHEVEIRFSNLSV
jgi:hypothetical protein